MILREFWLQRLNEAWEKRPLIWLSGVRRTGKTTLCKMLSGAVYMNCDLPSVKRQLEDPEFFYNSLPEYATLIFDEIHRASDPSMILKIGSDEFPHLKIIATGSSTIEATKKFRDSLTGRKTQLFFPPVMWNECLKDFKMNNLDKRLLQGGLPEMLLAGNKENDLYSEWIDSYYARDIQELFNVRNRTGFLKLLQLLFLQSGGLLEVTSLARDSSLSRPTVTAHIETLAVAHTVNIVPPWHGGGFKEIIKRPKVYGFDTGFVSFIKGWNEIRENDRGLLWEHLVLDMLKVSSGKVWYWRSSENEEIDFITKDSGANVHTIECKINPEKYNSKSVRKFRKLYPSGKNYCYSPFVLNPYKLSIDGIEVIFCNIPEN